MLNSLSHLTIRARFRLVIGIVSVALVGLGAWGVIANRVGIQKVEQLFDTANGATAQVGQLRRSLTELRRLEAQMVAVGSSNSVEVQRLRGLWKAEAASVKQVAAALQASHPESDTLPGLVTQLGQQLEAYVTAIDPIAAQLEAAQIDGPVALAYVGQAEPQV
jgi:methyl-accepting chemotaxis protein